MSCRVSLTRSTSGLVLIVLKMLPGVAPYARGVNTDESDLLWPLTEDILRAVIMGKKQSGFRNAPLLNCEQLLLYKYSRRRRRVKHAACTQRVLVILTRGDHLSPTLNKATLYRVVVAQKAERDSLYSKGHITETSISIQYTYINLKMRGPAVPAKSAWVSN
jgi:hypothetical protein